MLTRSSSASRGQSHAVVPALCGWSFTLDPYADHVAYGNALIRTAIDQAVGRVPGDVLVLGSRLIAGRTARRRVACDSRSLFPGAGR
jgi:hypothetical protein